MGDGIYIASKAKHGRLWRDLRASGVPIISTWIDESEPGQTADWGDLWTRALREASSAAAGVVYNEPDERMKGGLVEIGAALCAGVPLFWAGPSDDPEGKEYTVIRHPLVVRCASLDHALRDAQAIVADQLRKSTVGTAPVVSVPGPMVSAPISPGQFAAYLIGKGWREGEPGCDYRLFAHEYAGMSVRVYSLDDERIVALEIVTIAAFEHRQPYEVLRDIVAMEVP
jgi:hypothetical protein